MTGDAVAALELRGVWHRYGALRALEDAGLRLRPGTVHALLGENGAGKSTLMQVAYGLLQPDEGEILVSGVERRFASPLNSLAAGIGMVHQHFSLVPAMTVAENIALGRRGRLIRSEAVARVRTMSDRTGFELDPDARVETLPVGAQQRVEIAKALAHDARILILDEPTAVLSPREVDDLLSWLRTFVATGASAILITHKLREAFAVADDVTVLRRGRVAFAGRTVDTDAVALSIAMVGERSVAPARSPRAAPSDQPIVRAQAIAVADSMKRFGIRDATFSVHAGELLGVAGVEGAGHRELLRAVAGRLPVSEGTLITPSQVGFIPDDRHRDAVLLRRSVAENVALHGAGSRRGAIDWAAEHRRASALMQDFDVRASDSRATLDALSGGNQQKLVVARELMATRAGDPRAPRLIVAENPTRGLDIRATAEVHARLLDARDEGAAVIVYSSDLDEVLSLATRMLVVFAGAVREMPADREQVARAMLGLD